MHNTTIPTINFKIWDWGISIENFKNIYILLFNCTISTMGRHSTCTATMATSSL